MRSPAHEAGTENGVGVTRKNRFEQFRVILWIIFKVRILHENDLSCGRAKTCAQSCPLALVVRLENRPINSDGELVPQQVCRSVGRTVVYHDELEIADTRGADIAHNLGNCVSLVKAGDNDGHFHEAVRLPRAQSSMRAIPSSFVMRGRQPMSLSALALLATKNF